MPLALLVPNYYSPQDPEPIVVYGEALVSRGLEVRDGINGLGLVSFGLIWSMYDIWVNSGTTLSTAWASGPTIVTNWTQTGTTIVTNWTSEMPYGIWGDYNP